MTKTVITFPVRRTTKLFCVWFETGNPNQPLACKWVTGRHASATLEPPSVADSRPCLICA
jgi:hypothetical protein